MNFIRGVYVMVIGVLIVLLVIFGIEAFYPEPPYPEYLSATRWLGPPPPYDSPEYGEWQQGQAEEQQEWMKVYEAYRQEVAIHHRNIFFVVLPLGLVFAVGGTFIRRRLDIFGAGLILGGLGTMIYAIAQHNLDSKLRFAGVAVALVVLIFVGYKAFLSSRTH